MLELPFLLEKIERRLDWGKSDAWNSGDFEHLHLKILEHTGVSLSTSTLRRVWGKVEYDHLPSTTTLNTLARFAGFESWRDFIKKQQPVIMQPVATVLPSTGNHGLVKTGKRINPWVKILSGTIIILGISLVLIFAFKKPSRQLKITDYQFSSKPVTRSIPNSVIFTYDAAASPSDSVYIQQSWDASRRVLVNKHEHTHTSVYYEPGFYTAKLVIDSQVVQEHALLVPSNGWLVMIDHMPVPVYLEQSAFMRGDSIGVALGDIEKNNIPLGPVPPVVKYYNVGNFPAIPLSGLCFSAEVKNNYHEGTAACQLMNIILITDDSPVIIPLSAKGCVSELNMLSVDKMISGRTTDLSGFGVDFSNWAKLVCKAHQDKLQYFVNEQLALEAPLPSKNIHVVGVAFAFQGNGTIRNVRLSSGAQEVFNGR